MNRYIINFLVIIWLLLFWFVNCLSPTYIDLQIIWIEHFILSFLICGAFGLRQSTKFGVLQVILQKLSNLFELTFSNADFCDIEWCFRILFFFVENAQFVWVNIAHLCANIYV